MFLPGMLPDTEWTKMIRFYFDPTDQLALLSEVVIINNPQNLPDDLELNPR